MHTRPLKYFISSSCCSFYSLKRKTLESVFADYRIFIVKAHHLPVIDVSRSEKASLIACSGNVYECPFTYAENTGFVSGFSSS